MNNLTFSLTNKKFYLVTLVIIAFLSFFIVPKVISSIGLNTTIQKSLDDKKMAIIGLTTGAVTASTAITLIPGDVGIPIANQLIEISKWLLFTMGVIFLESMLVSIFGFLSFQIIIPLSCFIGVLYLLYDKVLFRNLAIKLSIFAIVLFIAIPISIFVSDLMYATQKTNIELRIENTKQEIESINESKNKLTKENKNIFDSIGEYINDTTSKIGKGVAELTKKGEDMLISMLETVALLIVTTCVIPVFVFIVLFWIVKILFGFDVKTIIPKNNTPK